MGVPLASHTQFVWLKWGSLTVVVLQNCGLYLVAHASVQGGQPYFGSVAVLLTELVKAAVSLTSAVAESGVRGVRDHVREMARDPSVSAAFAIPAGCYQIHNNLWYVAVANLDPVTIAVTTQLKIVFAALFSRLLLGRRLSAVQCGSIAVLILGLSLLQHRISLHSSVHAGHGSRRRRGAIEAEEERASRTVAPERDEVRGLLAMAGVCVLSGLAGVLTEKLLKEKQHASSLWMRNVQMALFSSPMAAATVLLTDGAALRVHGPWAGFNAYLLATSRLLPTSPASLASPAGANGNGRPALLAAPRPGAPAAAWAVVMRAF